MKNLILLPLICFFGACSLNLNPNEEARFQSLKHACEQNDFQSCGILGNFYKVGMGFKVDLKKSKNYFKKACDADLVEFCLELAALLRNENKFDKSNKLYQKAYILYKKACESKDKNACKALAAMNFYGLGVKNDKVLAKKYYQKACEFKDNLSCVLVQDLSAQGF